MHQIKILLICDLLPRARGCCSNDQRYPLTVGRRAKGLLRGLTNRQFTVAAIAVLEGGGDDDDYVDGAGGGAAGLCALRVPPNLYIHT